MKTAMTQLLEWHRLSMRSYSETNKMIEALLEKEKEQIENDSLGFAEWCAENDYKWHKHFDNLNGGSGVWYHIDDYENIEPITSKGLFEKFIQFLKPKTEVELCDCSYKEHDDICNYPMCKKPSLSKWDKLNKEFDAALEKAKTDGWFEKRKPTSPSIEKMAHEYAKRKSINGVDYKIVKKDFIEGYKANNSLEELEKWIINETNNGDLYLWVKQTLDKIQELKTNNL